mmetsp:Transcript_14661/g.25975  ORF Transcript_14661/g.25975 Transcript_14661/m.25975 type:complete len:213 (-) Transcript_14661:86-724(-)
MRSCLCGGKPLKVLFTSVLLNLQKPPSICTPAHCVASGRLHPEVCTLVKSSANIKRHCLTPATDMPPAVSMESACTWLLPICSVSWSSSDSSGAAGLDACWTMKLPAESVPIANSEFGPKCIIEPSGPLLATLMERRVSMPLEPTLGVLPAARLAVAPLEVVRARKIGAWALPCPALSARLMPRTTALRTSSIGQCEGCSCIISICSTPAWG